MKILTLDIGGTAVKYGIFENEKANFGQFPVFENGIENIPKRICDFVIRQGPDFVSLSSPGPFDFETGTSCMQHKLKSMYGISLYNEIKSVLPDIKLCFVHDSTAFAIGAMQELPYLKDKTFAAVMLGTGLGFAYAESGKVFLNSLQTPFYSLWNKSYKDGITEDYVSTRAIVAAGSKCGFPDKSVREMAECAGNGEKGLQKVFFDYGVNLGLCISEFENYNKIENIVIGGQISLSWNIIKPGFESVCEKQYEIIRNPAECALLGLYDCAINGKASYCKILEEAK